MEEFNYQPSADLELDLATRLKQFPREPDMLTYFLRSSAAVLVRLWLKFYHRLEMVGLHNLPKSGSFVMVANHASHLDTPCLLTAIPLKKRHRAFPAAAEDYFFSSFPKTLFSAIFINALPFDRLKKGAESLEVCRRLLDKSGNILVLFPEGTRSPNGELQRFKSGIGRLVAGTEIPVIPCHLSGCHRAYPKGAWLPRPKKIKLTFGQPLHFQNNPVDKASVTQICETLHASVRELGELPAK